MILTAEDLLQSIWAALRRIETNLALPPAPLELPAPAITVLPPDLTNVVEAVNSLRPGATADDIAVALARVLAPQTPAPMPGVEEFAAAVKELSFRMKGMAPQAYGGGAVSLSPETINVITAATTAASAPNTGLALVNPVTTSGDTTVYTPAAGKAIKLKWLYLGTLDSNTANTVVTARFGASTTIYTIPMGKPGAFAHRTIRLGGTDQSLILNLSAAQPVYVDFDLEEI